MSKSKIIKTVIICLVFVALLAGLIAMMILPQNYGTPDSLDIANSNFGQRLLIGLLVALLGLGTVFIMLFLLIFTVTLMRLIFEGVGKMKAKQETNKSETVQEQSSVIIEEKVAVEDEDEEVVAVIMAALNAYYETQNATYKSNLKFRVRSIKEI